MKSTADGSHLPSIDWRIPQKMFRTGAGHTRYSSGRRLAGVVSLTLVLSSFGNYLVASWFGLSRSAPWLGRATGIYRRVGPQDGPQVFCAGSSLLIWGLSWPEISKSLGQGIENWSVGGSSPEIWEVFQQRSLDANTTIIGISVYDLNEMRLTPERARYVPLTQTVTDLWTSGTELTLCRRILNQYAMTHMRLLFPMAGDSDKVLVEVRRKLTQEFGLQASLGQQEDVLFERDEVLDAGEFTMKLSDWSAARVLRRTALLPRRESRLSHEFFHGPKYQALKRILLRARHHGRVIVVVLPVARAYAEEFLDTSALAAFESALHEAVAIAPEATVVRLDRVPGITDNEYFADLVHLNSYGRRLATPVFLKEVTQSTSKGNSHTWLNVSNPGKRQ
jgi:hypothetical protein